jgi:[ribosomal protein S5]-alanine N-acetyltransferase
MITTSRLNIWPLSSDQLQILVDSPDEFAGKHGLIPSSSLTDPETRDAILSTFLPNLSDPSKDPDFWTLWILVDKGTNAIAGGICFHGEPDEQGEVEIGYGTDEKFRNQGIMTETIAGLLDWMRDRKKVRSVKAETDLNNPSSIKVLEKNGFRESGRGESSVILRLDLK